MLNRVISLAFTACLTTLPLLACATGPQSAPGSSSSHPVAPKVAANARIADNYDNGSAPALHSNAALVMPH